MQLDGIYSVNIRCNKILALPAHSEVEKLTALSRSCSMQDNGQLFYANVIKREMRKSCRSQIVSASVSWLYYRVGSSIGAVDYSQPDSHTRYRRYLSTSVLAKCLEAPATLCCFYMGLGKDCVPSEIDVSSNLALRCWIAETANDTGRSCSRETQQPVR